MSEALPTEVSELDCARFEALSEKAQRYTLQIQALQADGAKVQAKLEALIVSLRTTYQIGMADRINFETREIVRAPAQAIP